MRCPSCGTNHKKKAGNLCSCGYKFLFRPDAHDGWTDGKFLACVHRASRGDTAYFTADQFFTACCRMWASKRKPVIGISAIVIAVLGLLYLAWNTFLAGQIPIGGFVFGCFISLVVGLIGVGHLRYNLPKRRVVDYALKKWIDERGPLDMLITEPRLNDPPPDYEEPDIYDYGVECILIVQHDLMVDEFVLNNMHAEMKALVLSTSGYPWYITERAQQLVLERDDLPVYLLHDATPSGRTMQDELPIAVPMDRVIDLGLHESDTQNIGVLKLVHRKEPSYANRVSMIPTAALAGLITPAIMEQVAIQEVLERRAMAEDSSGFFGYG